MDRQYAPTDTTIIIPTLARLTATTVPTGLWAECLSAPARGMAGVDAVGVVGVAAGVDAIGTVIGEGSAAAVSSAPGALTAGTALHAGRLAAFTVVADSMAAVEGSTVAAVEVSTVAAVEGSTVAAVEGSTAAAVEDSMAVAVVIGNRGLIRISP